MTFQVTIMFGLRFVCFMATILNIVRLFYFEKFVVIYCRRFVFDAITTVSSMLKCSILVQEH